MHVFEVMQNNNYELFLMRKNIYLKYITKMKTNNKLNNILTRDAVPNTSTRESTISILRILSANRLPSYD